MNGIVKNISALSIQTTGQIPSITKGQKQLLSVMRKCIEDQKPLTFEMVISVYYSSVRKNFHVGQGWYYPEGSSYGRYREYVEYDILECWKKQILLHKFRSHVRQWFVNNIGTLVIKNQLVIIPTIDLGEEESNG